MKLFPRLGWIERWFVERNQPPPAVSVVHLKCLLLRRICRPFDGVFLPRRRSELEGPLSLVLIPGAIVERIALRERRPSEGLVGSNRKDAPKRLRPR